jgi:replicative DNA helicase
MPILDTLSKLSLNELEVLGLTQEEVFTVELLTNPVKWAEEYLNWKSRDYQDLILEQGAKRTRLVLRLGRRLGKTECMCVLILWHAFTQINRDTEKIAEDPYDILILTPYEKQAQLIYDRLIELIEGSSELKGSISRKISMLIQLQNGTNIQLMTVGTGSGSGAAATRGQRADLLVYDEVDYIGEEEISNSIAIANEDKQRIRILAASTPSGDRRSYYNWCSKASHTYDADAPHIEATGTIKYDYTNRPGRTGNAWTHIYAPSTVNKKLNVINPDTGMTGLEELKEEFTEMKYQQEVMAEFGESQSGVYQKKYVDLAVQLGQQMNVTYAGNYKGTVMNNFKVMGKRILGVDWDKSGASTNMVGLQFIESSGMFVPFVRVEIPKHEFTYTNAVEMIIKLNNEFNFDWIFADAGHGEKQIEDLKQWGMNHPETGLQHKVVRVNMSEKITWRDPFTQQKVSHHIKPFMVNNLVRAFERGKFAFHPGDNHTIKQFTDYYVKRWGQDGRPVYTDENEHIHDCIMLAMHGFIVKYTDMLKVNTTVKISKLGPIDMGDDHILSREIPVGKNEEKTKDASFAGFALIGGARTGKRTSGRSSMGPPRRRSF